MIYRIDLSFYIRTHNTSVVCRIYIENLKLYQRRIAAKKNIKCILHEKKFFLKVNVNKCHYLNFLFSQVSRILLCFFFFLLILCRCFFIFYMYILCILVNFYMDGECVYFVVVVGVQFGGNFFYFFFFTLRCISIYIYIFMYVMYVM